MRPDCVFCQIVAGEAPATVVRETRDSLIIEPLGPVVEGHVLVIPRTHVVHAASNPLITAMTMYDAAQWAGDPRRPFNIITSAGSEATQSVFHLHLHVVPRRLGDGLHLPWTGQAERSAE